MSSGGANRYIMSSSLADFLSYSDGKRVKQTCRRHLEWDVEWNGMSSR